MTNLRKPLSVFLAICLLLSCVITGSFAEPAPVFGAAVNIDEQMTDPANWSGSNTAEKNADNQLVFKATWNWSNMVGVIKNLKANTTYQLNVTFKGLNDNPVRLGGDEWGVAIAPASVDDVCANNIITAGAHDTNVPAGTEGHISEKVFTTTEAGDYKIRIGFDGANTAWDVAFYNFTLASETVAISTTPGTAVNIDEFMTDPANWSGSNTAEKNADNQLVFKATWNWSNMVGVIKNLKANTTYQLNVTFKGLNDNPVRLGGDEWGVAIAPASVDDVCANNIITAGAHDTNVPAGTEGHISEKVFTTTEAGDYKIRIGFDGANTAWDVAFYNFTLTEKADESETTPGVPVNIDNIMCDPTLWSGSQRAEKNADNQLVFKGTWNWSSMVGVIKNLKANTTYVLNMTFKGLGGDPVRLCGDKWGVAIAPASVEDVCANNIITAGAHDTNVAAGVEGHVSEKVFTTTEAGDYKIRIGFDGTNTAMDVAFYNFTLTEKLPEIATTPGVPVNIDSQMTNPANWSGTHNTETSAANHLVIKGTWNWSTMVGVISGLKANTTYELNVTYKGANAVSLLSGDWGVAIAPASVANDQIVSNNLITSGSHDLDVAAGVEGHITDKRFTTTDAGDYKLRIGFSGTNTGMDVELYDFTLTEVITEPFSAAAWTVYQGGATNTFGGTKETSASVSKTTEMDVDGDGSALKIMANNAWPTVPFAVEKNTDYVLTFQYYANSGITDFAGGNFIIKEAMVSNGTNMFDFGVVPGNLAYSGFNKSFTTVGGDETTEVTSYTENLTNLDKHNMAGVWHTVTLAFNSADYEKLYLCLSMSWNTPIMYVDNIILKQQIDPAKSSSWVCYDSGAVDLNSTPSGTLTVTNTAEEKYVKYGSDAILLNTAGGHATVALEVEKNTDYYLYYYYLSETASEGRILSASTVLAPGAAFTDTLGSAVIDPQKEKTGAWNKAVIAFHTGANETVYLNVDVQNGVTGPVAFDGFVLRKEINNNLAMDTADYWTVYEDGQPVDGRICTWAYVHDQYDPQYDHDGDGHSLKVHAPCNGASVPLRNLNKNTWYRLTYWYYSDQQVTNYAGRDFILNYTKIVADGGKTGFGASEGCVYGINFNTEYYAPDGKLESAISSVDASCGTLASEEFAWAGNWHRMEMIFNSYSYENLNLVVNLPSLGGQMIDIAYLDDFKLERATAALLETDLEASYCEKLYDGIPNSGFEQAPTDKDWGATLPSGMSIVTGGAPQVDRYASVTGTKVVYELRLKSMQKYILGAYLRGDGFIGIATDPLGTNLIANEEQTATAKLSADGAEWQRKGLSFRSSSDGVMYLVFDSSATLDIDLIQLFEMNYARTEDLNDYTVYEEFDFDHIDPSIIVLNGGIDADYKIPGFNSTDSTEESPETGEAPAMAAILFSMIICCGAVMLLTVKRKGSASCEK